jgi:hypothetical protein
LLVHLLERLEVVDGKKLDTITGFNVNVPPDGYLDELNQRSACRQQDNGTGL